MSARVPLQEALRRTPLLSPGDRVVVACSGGPDSLALLHALHALRQELGLADVQAAHFHHGLRGADADDDAAFVQAFCAERALPCMVESGDVGQLAQETRQSVQQAARAARYAFLDRAAQAVGASKIATAHTQDDQAETVLLNILRGTGLDGLRGIPAQRGKVIRPLLRVARAEVLAYCDAHSLTPRHDPSNADPAHYARNRARLCLLPQLERDFNPGVRNALLRLSESAARDSDYLRGQAHIALQSATLNQTHARRVLSVPALRALHPALLRHALRAALADLRGTGEGITFRLIEQASDAVMQPPAAPLGLTTPAPVCRVRVSGETVTLALDARKGLISGAMQENGQAMVNSEIA